MSKYLIVEKVKTKLCPPHKTIHTTYSYFIDRQSSSGSTYIPLKIEVDIDIETTRDDRLIQWMINTPFTFKDQGQEYLFT